jgi:hypothetical protein
MRIDKAIWLAIAQPSSRSKCREAHDLEGERRKRHADQKLGDAHAPAAARHDPRVSAAGEHAGKPIKVACPTLSRLLAMSHSSKAVSEKLGSPFWLLTTQQTR